LLPHARTSAGQSASAKQTESAVVFLGDSITSNWFGRGLAQSKRFAPNAIINRGVDGEVTAQMLSRFQRDVVASHPKVVVILGGTNDILKSQPSYALKPTEQNLAAMAELARKNEIGVVLASLPPVRSAENQEMSEAKTVQFSNKIQTLNSWLKEYSSRNHVIFVDYYSVLVDRNGNFSMELSTDGIHPNMTGYALMEPLAAQAVQAALREPERQNP
jgi:lysophospholipase L1-like esterase